MKPFGYPRHSASESRAAITGCACASGAACTVRAAARTAGRAKCRAASAAYRTAYAAWQWALRRATGRDPGAGRTAWAGASSPSGSIFLRNFAETR